MSHPDSAIRHRHHNLLYTTTNGRRYLETDFTTIRKLTRIAQQVEEGLSDLYNIGDHHPDTVRARHHQRVVVTADEWLNHRDDIIDGATD